MKKKALLLFLTAALLLLGLTGAAGAASNSDVMFAETSVKVFEGETVQLQLLTQGAAAGGTVTWKSSSMKTATVQDGLVTGLKKGSVTVTATVSNNGKTWRATCKVTVQRAATAIKVNTAKWNLKDPEEVSLGDLVPEDNTLPILLMVPGNRVSIGATVTPKDASSTKSAATSSDTDVLAVSGTSAKAVSPGTAVLTVYSVLNPEVCEEYLAVVLNPVDTINITGGNTVFVGGALSLTAECAPVDADMTDVTWKSSNNRIATVDEDGTVYGVARGTVTITASATDGSGVTRSQKVTVSVAPTAVTVKQNGKVVNSIILNVSAKTTLTAAVTPSTVSNKTVVWTSSDTSVATVTARGQVTGVGVGTAIISAESSILGEVCQNVTVTVVQPVTKVEPANTSVEIMAGQTIDTSWIVYPSNATIQDLTFTSSNTRVATVDSFGTVYGAGGGKATITATATDGSKKYGRMTVSVVQPATGVHMKSDSYRVGVDETATITAVLEPSDATDKRMTWYMEDSSIATIKGSTNQPKVTGLRWGTTVAYGITEDGGYSTSCIIDVGNLDRALEVTDLYIEDNSVYIQVANVSNLTISRFTYQVEVYDIQDNPLICSTAGTNVYTGSYNYTLAEGDVTRYSRYDMGNYNYPNGLLGRIIVTITGYSESNGTSHSIKAANRETTEYTDPNWVHPTPTPAPTATPDPVDGGATGTW